MSVTADPPAAQVAAGGGTSNHKLTNAGEAKIVFKVKSSNNTEYRIKPVFGFIDVGGSVELAVTRLAGPPKEDKLVVQFANAPADAADPQAAFGAVQPSGNVTIPLTAA